MLNDRLPSDALLAVYPDRRAAEAAADALADLGIARESIRIGDPRDEVTSLDAEVREETTQAFSSPTVGVAYPREAAKATAVLGPALVAVGVVIGALAALPLDLGGWPAWLRVLVGAVVGATMGGAIAVVIVPAMAVRNPHDPSPAESGTTLWVGDGGEPAQRALVATEPLRLDRLDGGVAIDTVATERDFRPGGIVEEVADNFAREAGADPEDRTR